MFCPHLASTQNRTHASSSAGQSLEPDFADEAATFAILLGFKTFLGISLGLISLLGVTWMVTASQVRYIHDQVANVAKKAFLPPSTQSTHTHAKLLKHA